MGTSIFPLGEKHRELKAVLSTPEVTRLGNGWVIKIVGPVNGSPSTDTTYSGKGETKVEAVKDLLKNIKSRNPGIMLAACQRIESSMPGIVGV